MPLSYLHAQYPTLCLAYSYVKWVRIYLKSLLPSSRRPEHPLFFTTTQQRLWWIHWAQEWRARRVFFGGALRYRLFFGIVLVSFLGLVYGASSVSAGVVTHIPGADQVKTVSMDKISGTDSLDQVKNAGVSVLHAAKIIIGGIALVYIVYLGAMIFLSFGHDSELTNAKKQLYIAIIGFMFLNIPGQLYEIFGQKASGITITSSSASNFSGVPSSGTSNLLYNQNNWNLTVMGGVVGFIKIGLIALAIFLFTLGGLQVMGSRGKDEYKKKAKGNIFYGVMALVFVSVIDVWVRIVATNNIVGGQRLFAQLSNLALFFAGPAVVFYLIRGGYYYIMSAGDEAKAKKGKTIIINTIIAVLILLASYTFLLDLQGLVF